MDISLNAKIYNDLKEKIRNGIYTENGLIPTELQLQNIYGVSRAPVRQALGRLENDGLIIRKAGKGTFVAPHNCWQSASLGGFRTEFLKKADEVTCKTLSVKEIVPTQSITAILELQQGEKVIHVKRLRSIHGTPYQYLEHYIKDVPVNALKEAGDIEDMPLFLAQQGLYLHSVTESIEAVDIPASIAKSLKIDTKVASLRIKRCAYDSFDKMFEYVEYYTVTKSWKYRVKYEQY